MQLNIYNLLELPRHHKYLEMAHHEDDIEKDLVHTPPSMFWYWTVWVK